MCIRDRPYRNGFFFREQHDFWHGHTATIPLDDSRTDIYFACRNTNGISQYGYRDRWGSGIKWNCNWEYLRYKWQFRQQQLPGNHNFTKYHFHRIIDYIRWDCSVGQQSEYSRTPNFKHQKTSKLPHSEIKSRLYIKRIFCNQHGKWRTFCIHHGASW